MLDNTQQFEKRMIKNLSENIPDNEKSEFDILTAVAKYKILNSEKAKTIAISFSYLCEVKMASNYLSLGDSIQ